MIAGLQALKGDLAGAWLPPPRSLQARLLLSHEHPQSLQQLPLLLLFPLLWSHTAPRTRKASLNPPVSQDPLRLSSIILLNE